MAEAEPIVRRAVEAGVTFFDTADTYSQGMTEEISGRLLAKLFSRRDNYVLAAKVFFPRGPGPNDRGLSRTPVLAGIDASLRRLGTDYVDLYQIHRWDPETPIEETMEALNDVVRAGKARYIGASTRAWGASRGARWRAGCSPATASEAASSGPSGPTATRSPTRCTSTTTSMSSTRSARSPASAACPRRRSRLPGCLASPP